MIKRKTVKRVVILLNKTLGDQIGEQTSGDQITVIIYELIYLYIRVIIVYVDNRKQS